MKIKHILSVLCLPENVSFIKEHEVKEKQVKNNIIEAINFGNKEQKQEANNRLKLLNLF